jgi:hypothetical protein
MYLSVGMPRSTRTRVRWIVWEWTWCWVLLKVVLGGLMDVEVVVVGWVSGVHV